MKKITSIYILTGLLTIGAVTSCKKDFLERPPLDQLSEATFWKNPNDVYQAVMAVYNQLPGDGIIYDDGATDNAHAQYPWESSATDVSAGTLTSTTDAGWSFIDIRRANYFLANADKVTTVDAALLERYKAEVRFLRALFYSRLTNKFGDVPLITTVLALGAENVPRTPKAEVVKFITDELDAVSKILPQSYA
ncbi:RagB/SusD family nutrient uptake outer membrane protein [Pedobacter panaciterrae]